MTIFLKFGQPYIDIAAEDYEGRDALTALLDIDTIEWYNPDIPSKIATLLRYGANPRSQNRDGDSCLHMCLGWFHPGRNETNLYGELLECLCLLINNGADVHAVSFDMSVTETAHESRAGQVWEEALESCNLDVNQVYALDHNRNLEKSSDIYAPTDQRPRVRGPMCIQAYHDKCRKGLQGCATFHRKIRHFLNSVWVIQGWTGKCRWPNGMIHQEHCSYNEVSDDGSSEQEEDNRVCTASDFSSSDSDTEDGSDEEIGGDPI